ncbi:hypothetical protein E3N88_26010 [Mikania micrantha]|uniref:Uncharacterized protein n=1 Tax=Mikania micrantha TaxID=192012 RepID=A0A5N6N943_9ASTR|nr:hypothetical protein E3N88_26010 [Mikania micrantha]
MARRIESVNDTIHYREETHVRQKGNNQYLQWFPDLVRSWVREERVPPPPTANTTNSLWTLPALGYPLEQAFAAFVARMEREIRNMWEVAGMITELLENNNWQTQMWDNLTGELVRTNEEQAKLVETIWMMRGTILELTARLETTELRVAVAEARAEEANARAGAVAIEANIVRDLAGEAMTLIAGHMRYQPGAVTGPAELKDSSSTVGSPNDGI